MDTNREREITSILQAFTLKQVQDSMTLFSVIKRKGVLPEEVVELVSKKIRLNNRRAKRHRQIINRLFKEAMASVTPNGFDPIPNIEKCPSCGIAMRLSDNRDAGDSHWTCPKCRFGRYVGISAKDELRRLLIEAQKSTQKQEINHGQ